MKESEAIIVLSELTKRKWRAWLNDELYQIENNWIKKLNFPREGEVILIKEIKEAFDAAYDLWTGAGLELTEETSFIEAISFAKEEFRIKLETLHIKRNELLKSKNSNDYENVFNELILSGVIKKPHKGQMLKLIENGRISPKIQWTESDWMLGVLMEYIIRYTKLELLPDQDLSDFIRLNFEDGTGNGFVNIKQNLKRAKETNADGLFKTYKNRDFSTKLNLAFNK